MQNAGPEGVPLHPSAVKRALERLGVKPSKRRGQSFLARRDAAERIASLAGLTGEDSVLEIGPGLGALTASLLRGAGRVVAIENDRRLAAWLRERFAGERSFELIEGDALKEDIPRLLRGMRAGGAEVKVVSNIPYAISGPLIHRLLGAGPAASLIVLAVQRELAARMLALPGGREYGAFTVLCRFRAAAAKAFDLPPSAFFPRPAVVSTVVTLRPRHAPPFCVGDAGEFLAMVRTLFSYRRKTIGTALKKLAPRIEGEETLGSVLRASGIERRARPEQISLEQFAALSNAIAALRRE